MTTYIDTTKASYTAEELMALCAGTAKPYPSGWYKTEEEVLAGNWQLLWDDAMDDEADIDWSEGSSFNCSVVKWENLRCDLH